MGAGQSPEDSFVWHRPNLNSYKRHNIEESLEGSGLEQRVPQPPAICFVDLTGYAPPNRGARRRGRRSGRGAAGRSGERHFTASRRPGCERARGWRHVLFPTAEDGSARGRGIDAKPVAYGTSGEGLKAPRQPGLAPRLACAPRGGYCARVSSLSLLQAPNVSLFPTATK